jgi:CDP-diacylglycerol--glycerol-3-phosphate 3-phosphatidyltransferase
MRMNLPNQITVARFFLAIISLLLLAFYEEARRAEQLWILDAAFWIFVIAGASDFLDGYLARKHNQVTSFGRILDPFVDKILVCGGFTLLLGAGFNDSHGVPVTGLSAWMVVLIIARELLVSGLRGFSEAAGKPYAANYWGKVKMVVQCSTVPLIIQTVGRWRGIEWILVWRTAMIWLSVVVTAGSVAAYLVASREALSERSRG